MSGHPAPSVDGAEDLAGETAPRKNRWLRIAIVSIGAALLGMALCTWGALAFIQSDRGRRLIVQTLEDQGLVLDYDRLVVRPARGRLALEGLRLAMPEPHADVADRWLEVDRLHASWSPMALLSGHVHVEHLLVEGIRLHVVIDEDGRDSVTLAFEGLTSDDVDDEDDDDVPRSHALVALDLPVGLTVDALQIQEVVLSLTERLGDGRRRSTTVDGLEVGADARLHAGPLEGRLRLSSPERTEGTRIVLTESDETTRVRELDLRWWKQLVVTAGTEARLTGQADVLRQSFDPELQVQGPLLALEAALAFAPDENRTRLEIDRFDLLDETARLSLALAWADDEALPRLERGSGAVSLDPLAPLISSSFRTVISEDVTAELFVHAGRDAAEASLELRANVGRLGLQTPTGVSMIENATLHTEAELRQGALDLRASLPLDRLSVRAPDDALELERVVVDVTAEGLRPDVEDLLASRGQVTGQVRAERVGGRGSAGTMELERARAAFAVPLGGRDDAARPSIELSVDRADAHLTSGLELEVTGARIDAGTPDGIGTLPSRIRLEGTGAIRTTRITTASREGLEAEDVSMDIDALFDREASSSLHATARVAGFRAYGGPSSVRLQEAAMTLDVEGVRLEGEDAAVREAAVALELGAKRARLRTVEAKLATDTLALSLAGKYRPAGTSSLEGVLRLAPVRASRGSGKAVTLTSAGSIDWRATELVLDPARPLRSRGVLRAKGRLAPFVLDLEGRAASGDAHGELRIRIDRLGELWASVMPDALQGVDLAKTALDLRATGDWRGLGSSDLALEHHVEAELSNAGMRTPAFTAALGKVELVGDHSGSRDGHTTQVVARVVDPVLDDRRLEGAFTLTSAMELDPLGRPKRIRTTLAGPRDAEVHAEIDARLGSDGSVRHTERLSLGRLDRLAGLLPAALPPELDLARLRIEVTGEGSIEGALRPDRSALAKRWHEATMRQSLAATVRHFRHTPQGLRLVVPEARVELDAHGRQGQIEATARLSVPRVELEDATHGATVHGLEHELALVASGLGADPSLTVDLKGRVARVEQDLWSEYPMQDLTLSGRARVDALGTLELERLVVDNERGGTRLELAKRLGDVRRRGGASRVGSNRSFSMQGRLVQDLARLDRAPRHFSGRGRVKAPFSVDSGDGTLFRVSAQVELEGVDLELPAHALQLTGARASISIEEAIEWTPEAGLVLVPHTERDAFSRVRFQDIQPFLSGRNHVQIDRLRWKGREAGPLVGSLRVERNVFAVDKLELQKDDALLSGQLVVDYLPGAERVKFRGKLTGLRPKGSKDPVDANAAIVLHPARLELDGRIQIVRISRKHLLELIDLVDPYREEASLNLLRRRLGYGYPKRVSIALSQGLMSMEVELGGVFGSMIKIDQVRGIALGPFLNRHVAPLVPW